MENTNTPSEEEFFTNALGLHRSKNVEPISKPVNGENVLEKRNKIQRSPKIVYICEKCQLQFENEDSYYNHSCTAEETESTTVLCEFCSKPFANLKLLHLHKFSHLVRKKDSKIVPIENGTSICNLCGLGFRNPTLFKEHQKEHAAVNSSNFVSFSCSTCTIRFSSKYLLQLHLKEGDCKNLTSCILDLSKKRKFDEHDIVPEINNNKSPKLEEKSTPINNNANEDNIPPRQSVICCVKSAEKPMSVNNKESSQSKSRTKEPSPPKETTSLVCHRCNQYFLTEGEFSQHAALHEIEDHRAICKISLPNLSTPVSETSNSNLGLLNCKECTKTFQNETRLLAHYRHHIESCKFFCNKCHEHFNQVNELRSHKLTVHGISENQPYHCYICLKRFAHPHAIINHMRIHTGEVPFECHVCGRAFNQLGNLQRHLTMHRGDRPHKCSECGKGFSDPATLRNHVRIHTGEAPFKCPVCSRGFTQIGNLKRHMNKHLSARPHRCNECGQGFAHESTLRNHLRTHTGEQPFQCTHCGRAFSQIGNLKRHMSKHSGQQDFLCEVCHQRFDTADDMVNHHCLDPIEQPLVINEDEKEEEDPLHYPPKCNMIAKWVKTDSKQAQKNGESSVEHTYSKNDGESNATNSNSNNLNNLSEDLPTPEEDVCSVPFKGGHLNKRKWRVFPCPVCGKVYTWQYDLKIHYRIHTGEKPYKCDICQKGFAQSGAVRTHKRKHHADSARASRRKVS